MDEKAVSSNQGVFASPKESDRRGLLSLQICCLEVGIRGQEMRIEPTILVVSSQPNLVLAMATKFELHEGKSDSYAE